MRTGELLPLPSGLSQRHREAHLFHEFACLRHSLAELVDLRLHRRRRKCATCNDRSRSGRRRTQCKRRTRHTRQALAAHTCCASQRAHRNASHAHPRLSVAVPVALLLSLCLCVPPLSVFCRALSLSNTTLNAVCAYNERRWCWRAGRSLSSACWRAGRLVVGAALC